MKFFFAFLLAGMGFIACKNNDKKATGNQSSMDSIAMQKADSLANLPIDTANNTTIQWLDSTFLDLGKREEGKSVDISFRFKNTGTKSLVIKNVTAQCGCTIPEKPEKPFAPGEEGVIKAKYNGSGHGETRKEVYVTANTNPSINHTLTFRADMEKK